MAKEGFRRRKVIVDRRFQLGVSARVVLFLAGYFLLFYLMAVFAPFLLMVFSGGTEEAMVTATRRVTVFVEELLLPLGLTFACLALHCILLTHRIAGPVFRLRRTMDDAAGRDWSKDVHLRDGDYLGSLADGWNLMVDALRRDVDMVRAELREALAEARAAERGGAVTQSMIERMERAALVLDTYRIGPGVDEDVVSAETGRTATARAPLGV
jgi:hypothetical protein